MLSGSVHLAEREQKARADAVKRIGELFQTATEAQLKMALHSQLDGSKVGLEKLDSALSESQTFGRCDGEYVLFGQDSRGNGTSASFDRERKSVGWTQDVSGAVSWTNPGSLQELEGIRDELMCEVYREHSKADLETLLTYFRGVDELNKLFHAQIILIGSRITSAVVTQHTLVVDCVRVIDREERADAIWEKRSEKNQFRPEGRPKSWKKLLFVSIAKAIRDKVFGSALDSDTDKNRLVRHNEAIRLHTLADLKIAKNICPTYFPPDYGIFDRFVEMYHNAIGAHVEAMVMEGLSDTQIVQLLGWINSYHTEEFMKEPALDIEFARLTLEYPINLLPEAQLETLREQYVSKTVERLRTWLTNSLTKDSKDWQRAAPPEADGSSYYFTGLPVLVMTPLNEMIGKGNLLHFLGGSVRGRFLVKCVDQMNFFVREYDASLKQYHQAYLQDRSQFRFYIEYILANANNAVVIGDSFETVVNQESAEDSKLRGRVVQDVSRMRDQFNVVCEHCRLAAEETILMDMTNVLKNVMTPQWLRPEDITANCLAGTLADYDETLQHVRPKVYKKLVDHLAERLLVDYMRVLLVRRCVFRSDSERRQAGEKIINDCHAVRSYFEEKMHVKGEVITAYGALEAIAQFFLTTDASMLSLDVANIVREFPDVRSDQLYSILMARGDIRGNVAKELVADDPNPPEMRTKNSPLSIFTTLAENLRS